MGGRIEVELWLDGVGRVERVSGGADKISLKSTRLIF